MDASFPTKCNHCGKDLAVMGLNRMHEPKWALENTRYSTVCPHCSKTVLAGTRYYEAGDRPDPSSRLASVRTYTCKCGHTSTHPHAWCPFCGIDWDVVAPNPGPTNKRH